MVWVLPGLAEVFASPFLFTSILMSELFPTFDLPIKANSGYIGGGHLSVSTDDLTKEAEWISSWLIGLDFLFFQPCVEQIVELRRLLHHGRMSTFFNPIQFCLWKFLLKFFCDLWWSDGVIFSPD